MDSRFPGLSADPARFAPALERMADPVLVCSHNDADGLSAAAILLAALERAGRKTRLRIVGRGENAYSDSFAREIASEEIGGLIIADLGTSDRLPRRDVPVVVLDHHVPSGLPREGAVVIQGLGEDPVPTTSLLAFRCARALGPADDLLWLAAIGIIGDLSENDGFPEMAEARAACGVTALRKAAALVNAPRRSASGDASAALALLRKAEGPKDVLSGRFEETAALLAARDEVRAELERARKIGPRVVGEVALVTFSSPTQIHPLVAQAWRTRLKGRIVLAANTGYREGYVHFAARTGADHDILAFLAEHRPPGATEEYGNGHRAASGGALRLDDWALFLRAVGFGEAPASPAKDLR